MTAIDDAPSRTLSAPELVDALRQAIIRGELVPKQRLVEADLAEEYGASRGNIRTALAQLTVEGLVERVQNRGARVRAVSIDEAVEITEVRAALEALCARKAAERITDDETEELRELAQQMQDAVERGDRESYSQGNQRLHARVIEISAQRTAAATIQRLRGQAVRFQFQLARQPGRPSVSLPQHLAIIDAICRHDQDDAAEAMRLHLESVADAIRATGTGVGPPASPCGEGKSPGLVPGLFPFRPELRPTDPGMTPHINLLTKLLTLLVCLGSLEARHQVVDATPRIPRRTT